MDNAQLPIDGVDVSGLDEAELLAALYNAAKPIGLGIFHYDPEHQMTAVEAREIIKVSRALYGPSGWGVDYIKGRPIKIIVLDGTLTGAWLYDRDQGPGKCVSIIATLRARTP